MPTDAGIAPFSAHYVAEWKNISVGTSDLELKRDAEPGHYIYKWTIAARGIFRLVYSNDVTQQSWFAVVDEHIRPEKYLAEQGSSRVIFDFDWATGHARGFSEEKPVDLVLKPGTQDLMSIQIEVMLDLKNGDLPKIFYIIDKDQIKDFTYAQEGSARSENRDWAVRHRHRLEPAHRQRSRVAHVVRALVGLLADAGRAIARRQTRICDADQEPEAVTGS